ncbi:FAD-dependent monooxygenase [Streptomyces oryzae]|uniref:FAD-dependent monooxygenase n=1 Tax=Streptomyces oryzae TaxID=1434886 RepID=A0ABS3XGD1_9ACTN|nr:FAD-dependent monooxygenase [Streptomyces oryzae]MBO8194371.1 FAD-dependent monooxygenase [Streptomyces oryzae]
MQTVLVSGASVAGLTLAHWLRRCGLAPTVVERAPAVRPGGHAIDVRGVALDVLDRMGLLGEARAARTRMRGMSMHDGDGNELWRSTEMTHSSGRLDSDDIELLREDLTALLHRRIRAGDEAEFLFGDSVAELEQTEGGVHVTFASGTRRTFDYVVGADGLHSGVRRLAFGPEADHLRHLGSHLAVFTTDNFLGLDNWQVWVQGESAGYCLYPVRDNTELRATLGFMSESLDYDHRDTAQQQSLLAQRMASLGGDTSKLLDAMRTAPDFYFDAMAQIHMDGWTRGRVALVGDAGYCPSPLSGQGTSLALVGAYVLAEELGRSADPAVALPRYEERMRPYAALNQALATENPGRGASEESLTLAKNAITLGDSEGSGV